MKYIALRELSGNLEEVEIAEEKAEGLSIWPKVYKK